MLIFPLIKIYNFILHSKKCSKECTEANEEGITGVQRLKRSCAKICGSNSTESLSKFTAYLNTACGFSPCVKEVKIIESNWGEWEDMGMRLGLEKLKLESPIFPRSNTFQPKKMHSFLWRWSKITNSTLYERSTWRSGL